MCMVENYLHNKDGIFQDKSVFGESYEPENIRFRETQLKELRSVVKPISRNIAPGNTVLYGMPGTGKNCSIDLIFREITGASDNAIIVPIKCRINNTPDEIICEIIYKLSGNKVHPEEKTGDELTDLLKELVISKGKIILIYLNDINHLMICGNLSETLNWLLWINNSLPESRISIIATVNDRYPKVNTNLDPSEQDAFRQTEIAFPAYTRDEITAILTERAEKGFMPGALSTELTEIAASIAYLAADVQFGLDLLHGAGIFAEKRGKTTIKDKHIWMYAKKARELHHDRMVRHLTPIEWEIFTRITGLEGTIKKYFSDGPRNRPDPEKPKESLLEMIINPGADSKGEKKQRFHILDLWYAVDRFSELGLFDAGYP